MNIFKKIMNKLSLKDKKEIENSENMEVASENNTLEHLLTIEDTEWHCKLSHLLLEGGYIDEGQDIHIYQPEDLAANDVISLALAMLETEKINRSEFIKLLKRNSCLNLDKLKKINDQFQQNKEKLSEIITGLK